MRIHYLGPAATFTHQAGLQLFKSSQLTPAPSIEDVLDAVKKNRADLGIVPVENSLEGIVIRTLDFILHKKLKVAAELNLPIKQNLLSAEKTLAGIKTVYSHPHAIAQTSDWLKKHLPHATIQETASTAAAAQLAASEPASAAIASPAAGQLYQLRVLGKDISNCKINITRFWVVSRPNAQPGFLTHSLPTKTSAYLVIHDKVGALRNMLDTFAQNEISLTSIQSRPLTNQPWKYGFFIDLLVDAEDPLAKRMFRDLKRIHPTVEVLGSYPQLGPYNHQSIITYNVKRIEKIFQSAPAAKIISAKTAKTNQRLQRRSNLAAKTAKISAARFLIIPSVALFKFKQKCRIADTARELELRAKIKPYPHLHQPYQLILKYSKQLQADIISLLAQKKISPRDIKYFNITDLRYYIDYLDTLNIILSN